MRFLIILISVKICLCFCNITHSNNNCNNNFEEKIVRIDEQLDNAPKNVSDQNIYSGCSTVLPTNSPTNKKEMGNAMKKTNKKSIKKPKKVKKKTKQKNKTKLSDSNEKKAKTKKVARKKLNKQSKSDELMSKSESKSEDSEEPKYRLREGEELLDFSSLAKIKSFEGQGQDSQDSPQIKVKKFTKDNPFLNWNCSSLSLQEEKDISTGYLDKRISHVITHAVNFPDGGTQLLSDMRQYYCYLKHVNQLVVDKIRRGKMLMKQLVEEDPEFTQIGFDTDELTDHFSWVKEESEAFEQIMDGICYQWKCMVARLKHK